jgi:RecB family exonuclease
VRPTIDFDPGKHTYTVDGLKFPSVTTILSVIDKPGLSWWGMKMGVEGVCQLARADENLDWRDPEGIVKLLTHYKLTVNHTLKKAGTRGTSLHNALEAWMYDAKAPNAIEFPAEDRGYVQALARALLEFRPMVVNMEVPVASLTYGFAGRYDLLADIEGEIVRIDLKTGKKIYPEQVFPQLAAYEFAAVECGEHESDRQMVLRLDADGSFETADSTATFADFLAIKVAFDAVQKLKKKRVAA